MPMRLNVPQLQACTPTDYERIARENPVIRRDVELLKARMVLADTGSRAPLPSVVGYMRTVQADRKDYAIMLSFARATARVNAMQEGE
jgi:hypothetical protein